MAYEPEYEARLIESQDEFVWEAPSHERHERGPKWYLIMGGIAMILVIYAIWTENFLFAFIVLIAGIILVLAGNEKPKKVLIQIGHNGVVWNGDLIPFEDLHNFAIVYQPPHIRVLYLEPRSFFRNRMRVLLGDQDPVAIREHLKQYLQEDLDLRDEHLSDILAKLFKL
ncbi:hypothetical protein GF380_04340 [Candidatus Uhrbacteria bacterium]|nr:hypothetical protein [Candidatus Uhrbacteria bacterium]MBD3284294.1 hypothetical protein [Candidatus Uhrbacteria bacterium]